MKATRTKTSTRKNQHISENFRRKGALERLEAQLKSGEKTAKKTFDKISLSDIDKKRINAEIGILKNKIKGQ